MMYCSNCGGKYSPKKNGLNRYKCSVCGSEKKPIFITEYQNSILFIGDTHIPFERSDYLDFILKVKNEFKCDEVYHVGDIVDLHSVSYHERDPDGMSAGDEFEKTMDSLEPWKKCLPNINICAGNHDQLITRQARTSGLPSRAIKTVPDMFEFPSGWDYQEQYIIDNGAVRAKVFHGQAYSGRYPHVTALTDNMMSVIIGHCHSVSGVYYKANEDTTMFGMSVGSGIDRHKYAFRYASGSGRKPIISCGLLLGGVTPFIVTANI